MPISKCWMPSIFWWENHRTAHRLYTFDRKIHQSCYWIHQKQCSWTKKNIFSLHGLSLNSPSSIGQILTAVDESGVSRNTSVFFTSVNLTEVNYAQIHQTNWLKFSKIRHSIIQKNELGMYLAIEIIYERLVNFRSKFCCSHFLQKTKKKIDFCPSLKYRSD